MATPKSKLLCQAKINLPLETRDGTEGYNYELVCERETHEPKAFENDPSYHKAWHDGYMYEWGGGDEKVLDKLNHPYEHTVMQDREGYYRLGILNRHDLGKFIEIEEGAITYAGILKDIRHFNDDKRRLKDARRARSKDTLEYLMTEVVLVRNNTRITRVFKSSDKFRMHFGDRHGR